MGIAILLRRVSSRIAEDLEGSTALLHVGDDGCRPLTATCTGGRLLRRLMQIRPLHQPTFC